MPNIFNPEESDWREFANRLPDYALDDPAVSAPIPPVRPTVVQDAYHTCVHPSYAYQCVAEDINNGLTPNCEDQHCRAVYPTAQRSESTRADFVFREECHCWNCWRVLHPNRIQPSVTQPQPHPQSNPTTTDMPTTATQQGCARCSVIIPPASIPVRRLYTRRVGGSTMHEQRVCQSCYAENFTCVGCGHECSMDWMGRVRDGENAYVCWTCTQVRNANGRVRYPRCINCSRYFPSVASTRQRDRQGYCSHCAVTRIASHNARISTVPVGKSARNIFYGMELEVELGQDCNLEQTLGNIKKSMGAKFVLIKRDGSLTSGFEIVTRPASLAEQVKHWTKFFLNGCQKGLKSYQTTTCGMHVHCTRKPLSELAIAKIVCFTNARHNRRFIAVIAGRTSDRWSKFLHKRIEDKENWDEIRNCPPASVVGYDDDTGRPIIKENPHSKIVKKIWRMGEDRYEAVNLHNENTVEFRIFRGTLKQESIYKNLEFCEALVRFCAPDSRSIQDCMSRMKFIEYIKERKDRYPHLLAFISAKFYGEETPDSKRFGFKVSDNQSTADQTEEQ